MDALGALDALSDTLKDIKPVPLPAPTPLKDVVKVDRMGEGSAASFRVGVLICRVFAGKKGGGGEAD